MYTRKVFIVIIFVLIAQSLYSQQFTDLYGDYLGQTPPGDSAIIFAPGIVSLPGRSEYRIIFSPNGNECFFTVGLKNSIRTYYTKRINKMWTEQVIASFSENENCMVSGFSADGNKLFFDKYSSNFSTSNIWMVERTAGGWGEPKILPAPINTSSSESYYTETTDGVIYISSKRTGGLGGFDIWCISNTSVKTAFNLGKTVNSAYNDAWTCVAPDESFLIFSSDRPGDFGNQDLYICFKKNINDWSTSVNMEINGAGINISHQHQFNPSLSPDGKFLFFGRHTESGDKCDIYWVSTKVIDDIKKEVFNSKVTK
jgi:hypothetical protein